MSDIQPRGANNDRVFRTAVYSKNLPTAERALRVAAALAGVAASFAYLPEAWMQWAGAASAMMIAVTGAVGFCPACYLVGRKLPHRPAS